MALLISKYSYDEDIIDTELGNYIYASYTGNFIASESDSNTEHPTLYLKLSAYLGIERDEWGNVTTSPRYYIVTSESNSIKIEGNPDSYGYNKTYAAHDFDGIYSISKLPKNTETSRKSYIIYIKEPINNTSTGGVTTSDTVLQFTIVLLGKPATPITNNVNLDIFYRKGFNIPTELGELLYSSNISFTTNYKAHLISKEESGLETELDTIGFLAKNDDSSWVNLDFDEDESFSISTDADWVTYNWYNLGTDIDILESNLYKRVRGILLKFEWLKNTTQYTRTATFLFLKKDRADSPISITIVLLGINEEYNPEDPDIPLQGDTFTVIDTNTGDIVDSTSLLFKNNLANVYKVLELKDNTLFLGNYIKNTSIYNQEFILYFTQDNITRTNENLILKKELNSSGYYSYKPNLTESSKIKKLFKKNEEYLLGVVFILKDGSWSSVFPIECWNPNLDIINTSTGNQYTKLCRKIIFNNTLVTKLKELNIIGVIPVCALNTTYNIICLGFLNNTISSAVRKKEENIECLYDWYLRQEFHNSNKCLDGGSLGEVTEILNLDYLLKNNNSLNEDDSAIDTWSLNNTIITLNSPEIEIETQLLNSMLVNCKSRKLCTYYLPTYYNDIELLVTGKYLYSEFKKDVTASYSDSNGISLTAINTKRIISPYLWYGFSPSSGFGSPETAKFVKETGYETNYIRFKVYPWLRNKVGAEGDNYNIKTKKYLNWLYFNGTYLNSILSSELPTINDIKIYENTSTIEKLKTNIYLGNIDYISTTDRKHAYACYRQDGNYPTIADATISDTEKAENVKINDIDYLGRVISPISIKYKVASHIVIQYLSSLSLPQGLNIVELYTENNLKKDINDNQYLEQQQWLKCGDIVPIKDSSTRISLLYEEGDYFFGMFDSFRTRPYTNEDINQMYEVVSAPICSRINLDARCDNNRGVTQPIISELNFNIFNKVYDQPSNYFTFSYIDLSDVTLDRLFNNTIKWSLTKSYGEEVDTWCNILDINVLDLDGNNGLITALKKYNNTLYCFLESGVSLILYNDNVQVSSTAGVPIEIANSGKVLGKRYITESLGCMNDRAISITPNAMYFIDGLNKSLYAITPQSQYPLDICSMYKMKSWALNNLDKDWWCYYDMYSQEILLTSESDCLAFNDKNQLFSSFLSYPNIKYTFNNNGREYLINTDSIWLKNSKNNTEIFGTKFPLEITYIVNPEPTIDKVFSTIEYRADVFSNTNIYEPNKSFTTLRVYNEYLDTRQVGKYGILDIDLVTTKDKPSILKKKFRNWYISIPRTKSYTQDGRVHTRDRFRNPWCYITLTNDNQDDSSIILYDTKVTYFI